MLKRFWEKPKEQRWRGWIFQIHLWSGLIIGLWAVVIGLSGSALVFKGEIEDALEPELFLVAPASGYASLEAVVEKVEGLFPEHSVLNLRGMDQPDRSWVARIVQRDEEGGFVNQHHVHFNPYTGEILGSYARKSGFFGFMEDVHFHLLAGSVGLTVNGVLAAAMLAMCGTGVVIWWPGPKSWKRALSVKLRAGWKRINYDLHSAGGFLTAAFLAAISFTGIYFAFPIPMIAGFALATGGNVDEVKAFFSPPKSTVVEGATAYSLDALFERRASLLPEDAVLGNLGLPQEPDAPYTLFGLRKGNPLFRGLSGAFLDRYSGEPLAQFDSREQAPGIQAVLMFAPLHFGQWGGLWSKALWFIVGFMPGALFLTGFLMWWNRVAAKRYRKWRGAAPGAELEPELAPAEGLQESRSAGH